MGVRALGTVRRGSSGGGLFHLPPRHHIRQKIEQRRDGEHRLPVPGTQEANGEPDLRRSPAGGPVNARSEVPFQSDGCITHERAIPGRQMRGMSRPITAERSGLLAGKTPVSAKFLGVTQ